MGVVLLYSLERFEDQSAVLQNELEEITVVDKSLLPPQAKTGDMFRLCDGVYRLDTEATDSARERIRRLQQLLRSRSER